MYEISDMWSVYESCGDFHLNVFGCKNKREVSLIQHDENIRHRFKFWRCIYPWKFALSAMRLLPRFHSLDCMKIIAMTPNAGQNCFQLNMKNQGESGISDLKRWWSLWTCRFDLIWCQKRTAKRDSPASMLVTPSPPLIHPLGQPQPNPGGECFAPLW